MKYILILLLSVINLSAQDLIVKKNGEEISSKILEVSQDYVKYKKFSNLNGPIYTLEKQNIIFIKYKNGDKDVFQNMNTENQSTKDKLDVMGLNQFYLGDNRITKDEFLKRLKENPKAYEHWKASRKLGIFSIILSLPSGASLGWGIGSSSSDANDFLVAGVVGSALSLLTAYISQTQECKALDMYNSSQKISYGIKSSKNGIGLVLNF